jgi:integrase
MLKILKRRQGSDTGPFKIDEPKKFVAWVRRRSGVYFTVHDLRRSFITYAESLDFGAYTIKALVNHSTGGNSRDVTEGYLQLSVERLRKPMNDISAYVLLRAKNHKQLLEFKT